MFRPLLGHLQALWEKKTDPRAFYVQYIFGSPMLTDCVI